MSTHERVLDLLQEWEEEHGRGRNLRPEDLCADCPELLPEVRRRLGQLDGFRRVFCAAADIQGTHSFSVPPSPARGHPAVAPPHLAPQLGRYQILNCLGQGSFGAVYKAYDPEAQRHVAIKVPHRHLVATTADADAYLAEARTLGRLTHANIVTLYDVGHTPDGLCYLVSQFVEGSDLHGRLARGRLSRREAVAIAVQVAQALHHAHRNGLIHRDVKPANILLDGSGHALVADFGLALREEDFGKGSGYAGTPAYMSPEQVRGEGHRVDARSDVYSLGAVLYQMLSGTLPFPAVKLTELFDQITMREPRSLRLIDETIPRELDRICLKCLAKRAGDRYSTALDLAEDLEHCQQQGAARPSDSAIPALVAPVPSEGKPTLALGSDRRLSQVMPKGLRSFDAADAYFFLSLVPGARDRDGLPESIRFWKQRIEATDPESTFPVGVLYGPSGSGKSSLVKAGVLPLLGEGVVAVYVEATTSDTEVRLLRALQRRCPGVTEETSLAKLLGLLRRGQRLPPGRKVLLVVDQLEQWLHARPGQLPTELVDALRQCDGERVQALLLVRDDFWMATTRLLRDIEIPLREGYNSAAADLFDMPHARKVLTAFGRAFGQLAETALAPEQERFLDEAVAGLAEEGKVVPVRLSLFAEMVKGKEWTQETLRTLGGAGGVGVTFLEETFAASTAPPEHRRHQQAARAVLRALLPEAGTDIKGSMRTREELLAASGYGRQPVEFARLLDVLDGELRLVTPSDVADDSDREGGKTVSPRGACYQLTHDYLVPAIRQWLTRKQRETRRGRAELCLAERAVAWKERHESRQLPSLTEWLGILSFTRRHDWSPPAREVMRTATRHYLVRATAVAGLLLLGLVLGLFLHRQLTAPQEAAIATNLVAHLAVAESDDVPDIIAQMAGHRERVDPLLKDVLNSPATEKEQLHARLALLPVDPGQALPLHVYLLTASPERLRVISEALRASGQHDPQLLWRVLQERGHDSSRRLRAACGLATFEPTHPHWNEVRDDVAACLVAENEFLADKWRIALRPVRAILIPALGKAFRDSARARSERLLAANLLADYAADRPDELARLIEDADEQQFRRLLPVFVSFPDRADLVARLRKTLAPADTPARSHADLARWQRVPQAVTAEIEGDGQGMLREGFALCQTLKVERCIALAQGLEPCGYRLVCFRPYSSPEGVRAAAVWVRDGRRSHWQWNLSADELLRRDVEVQSQGLIPFDVAAYVLTEATGKRVNRYAALWSEKDASVVEARLVVGEEEWKSHYASGYIPRTLAPLEGVAGNTYSAVWWRSTEAPSGYVFPTRPEEQLWYEYQQSRSLLQMDVRLAPATTLSSSEEMQRVRDTTFNIWKTFPLENYPLFGYGIACYYLGEYTRAGAALTDHCEQYPDEPLAYYFRALARGRLGRRQEAQADLHEFQRRTREERAQDQAVGGKWACYDVMVLLRLGETTAARELLEATVLTCEPLNNVRFLYDAACAHAQAAEVVPERREAHTQEAIRLLRRLFSVWPMAGDTLLIGYEKLQTDSDLDPIRGHPDFVNLVSQGRLALRYTGVWRNDNEFSSEELHGLEPENHRTRFIDLSDRGYLPKAISVAASPTSGPLRGASVWHHPVVAEADRDTQARRRANAAIGLLHLGHAADVWPLLGHEGAAAQGTDPRVRTFLLHRLARCAVDAQILGERFRQETDTAVRQALLLTLGDLSEQELPATARRTLSVDLQLQRIYQEDLDPGLHSAAEWLLRRWGFEAELLAAEAALAKEVREGQRGGRKWFFSHQNRHTLVVMSGRLTFPMGSPGHEDGRADDEPRHLRRVNREFAIATKEVTIEQFREFAPNYSFGRQPTRVRDLPMAQVNWHNAAAYCNWLSGKEGIPFDNWCYVRIAKSPNLNLASNYLELKGYRLPTEAEWEAACRAGTFTLRSYGSAEELLEEYAWYKGNSGGQAHPVGRLKPNDLGMFDMHGNVAEWCLGRKARYERDPDGKPTEDGPDAQLVVRPDDFRTYRGGHFDDVAINVRCARRLSQRSIASQAREIGFRVAKTIKSGD